MTDVHDDPLTAPATPPTARERARTRGHVRSFATDRTCAATDCETVLSRYNDSGSCALHERGGKRRI